ncbi:MAG: 23S rRNA (uracil(1939)-C(5))-methyltransferase RlmD [Lentimicrobiaceae bacterium]|nr:23S rRNA (uracil(1939)-C(5))-methyltransferase RlmD [Lentimicrobiaceae bacterium]
MRKKTFPIIEKVLFTDAGAEGMSVARINTMVLFVPNVVPGDVADVQITRKRKSYMEGKAIAFHSYSTARTEPGCIHFGLCGGCKWQNMDYAHQLLYKQKQVEDNFRRIGKFDFPVVLPILGSEKKYFYRNKLEYTFSNHKWFTTPPTGEKESSLGLGFHMPQLFDRVLDITECHLQPHPSNAIRLEVRAYAVQNNLDFFDARNHTGFLRNIIIRNNVAGQFMVILVVNEDLPNKYQPLLAHIASVFPEIVSLMYVVNEKKNDTISDLPVRLYSGEPFLMEKMEDLQFKIGPISFYQTNPGQAETLYKVAREFADLHGNETVYDLYTGTGTIAIFVASKAAKVIGIEYVPSAVEDAKINAGINGISNAHFFADDLAALFTDNFVAEQGYPDVVITDPPRSGMHPKVIAQLLQIEPKRIIYVSCNPATQARDIALLAEKYSVEKVQPVDMFPHTQHVENVSLLVRKS